MTFHLTPEAHVRRKNIWLLSWEESGDGQAVCQPSYTTNNFSAQFRFMDLIRKTSSVTEKQREDTATLKSLHDLLIGFGASISTLNSISSSVKTH